ncbi:MAG: amidohydrolase family protein [Burkholderiales bacterium]
MARTLIKNAWIVSMDPSIGDIEGGDLLIEGERIAEIGKNIQASADSVIDGRDRLIFPGMVNAHIHTWEYQLRGIGADWVSKRDYHGNMHGNLATRYTARDVYLGNALGALNQLRNGTTTILDWCHIVRDAEMADAAIDGLEESGIRAVFAHGTVKPPHRDGEIPFQKIPFPRELIHRLRTGRLASDERLVTLAMAILGPDWGEYDVAVHDIRLAREYGLINSAHTYGRPGQRVVEDGMPRLAKAGLLGPDHNIAHGNCFSEEELKIVLDAGCSISASCFTEALNYEQPAMLGRLVKFGGTPSLGTDCDPYFNSSMLWVTRHALMEQRAMDNRSLREVKQWPSSTQHSTHTRDALYWATMGGAKALRLDSKIGSLTPGKQADFAMLNLTGMNIFPALPNGDPAHVIVMYAESADVEDVMVAGRWAKRAGKLTYGEDKLKQLTAEVFNSRMRIMEEGAFHYQQAPKGPMPERFVF